MQYLLLGLAALLLALFAIRGFTIANPNVMARRVRTGAGVAALAAQIDDAAWNTPVGSDFDGTLGDGVLALWFDGYLHADDIRAALGTPAVTGDGLRGSMHWVAADLGRRGWGPATLALDGVELIDVGGGGEKISGDPQQFLLVATGRADPSPLGLDESVNIFG